MSYLKLLLVRVTWWPLLWLCLWANPTLANAISLTLVPTDSAGNQTGPAVFDSNGVNVNYARGNFIEPLTIRYLKWEATGASHGRYNPSRPTPRGFATLDLVFNSAFGNGDQGLIKISPGLNDPLESHQFTFKICDRDNAADCTEQIFEVSVNYPPQNYELRVLGSNLAGSVISNVVSIIPQGQSCGSTATQICLEYGEGERVTLQGLGEGSLVFDNWSGGACSGSNRTCVLFMNANQNVQANFITTPIQRRVDRVYPNEAFIEKTTVFTVEGSGLDDDLAFFVPECEELISLGGTSTLQRFQCTPMHTAGNKFGVVKSEPGGTVLHNFSVAVSRPVVIVLDAGHGLICKSHQGMDATVVPGDPPLCVDGSWEKQRPSFVSSGRTEDDFVLDVTNLLRDKLHSRHHNVRVVLIREDEYIPHSEMNVDCLVPCTSDTRKRQEMADAATPDIILSIHTNAGGCLIELESNEVCTIASVNPYSNGTETFWSQKDNTEEDLAAAIHSELVTLSLKDRGTQKRSLHNLQNSLRPVAIVEIAFHSNIERTQYHIDHDVLPDGHRLDTPEFLDNAAEAIYDGIIMFFDGRL